MKIRVTKLYLWLAAIILAWLSFTHATYVFNVDNRTPFGVLNLKQLIIKPDIAHTGIILDWETYTIKINPNHESWKTWQIRVYEICDENWENCKEVSTLWIWGSWNWITAVIGEQWKRCKYMCTEISTENINTIDCSGFNGDTLDTCMNLKTYWNTNNCDTNTEDLFCSNLMQNYIKLLQQLNCHIECTYDNIGSWLWSWITAFWTWGEICSLITGSDLSGNLICDNSVLQVLSGTIAQLVAMFRKTNTNPEYEFPGAIVTSWTQWGYCYQADETWWNIECDNRILENVIRQLLLFIRQTKNNPGSGFEYDPEFSGYEYDGSGYVYPGLTVNTTWANTWYYCSSTDWNTLECNNEVILWWDMILSWTLWKRCRYWAIINGVINWNPIQGTQQMIQTGIICTNDEPGHWMINNDNNTVYTEYWLAIWTDTHSGHALNVNWDWIITESLTIWTDTNSGYLNVNWSWRIETKLNIWDDFWFVSSEEHYPYVPAISCDPNKPIITSPTIRYNWTLAFRDHDAVQCENGYTEFGNDWKVWIGWPTETGTKLSVYGHTKIYSTASATGQYIELYNEFDNQKYKYVSNVISKWSDMRIGLTWDQDVVWIILPSAYIYINKTSIWINKEPIPSSRNASTQSWTYRPPLQIDWGIQLSRPSSNAPISNNSESKYICNEELEWTIEYYSWNFYGCMIHENWTYRRRKFNTENFGDDLPTAPAPGIMWNSQD